MTNLEDALAAVDAGADAVGFVFYEKSPRNVTVETAWGIVRELPESVEKVGVFVGESAERVESMSKRAGLSAVQVYASTGNGPGSLTDFVQNFSHRMFVAVSGERISSEDSFEWFLSGEFISRTSALFLDSGSSRQPGGTGEVFDWKKAAEPVKLLSQTIPVVVAGGLTPENVGEAIGILKPWGVDVVSGVEAKPGKKDPEKVRAFVKAVRAAG
jgi:phosphoribosylanthranilate isomerase